MRRIRVLWALAALPAVASAQQAPLPADVPGAGTAQGDVSVTIYNNDIALVQDVRALDLANGRVRQGFPDVSAQIRPETVSLLYPLAVVVMMVLALPFAYVQARSGGLSLKIFVGIMIGLLFHLMNNLFSHIGLLNTWPPVMTALTPSALFLLAAIASLWWVERH